MENFKVQGYDAQDLDWPLEGNTLAGMFEAYQTRSGRKVKKKLLSDMIMY
jgi:hypothetical protein